MTRKYILSHIKNWYFFHSVRYLVLFDLIYIRIILCIALHDVTGIVKVRNACKNLDTYEHRPTALDNYMGCNTESAYDVINIIRSLS
jgi:hypothetical protein